MSQLKLCPKCKSNHVVRNGYTMRIKHGKRVRYHCQECGKTFY